MKNVTLIPALVVFAFLCVPFVTQADLVPCDGPTCQTCHLVTLVQNIVKFLVAFLVIASTIIFAVAGFKMVISKGNPGEISAAKEMMSNAIIGLVVVLAAWLIVDTFMKIFVNKGALLKPWNEIECAPQPVGQKTPVGAVVAVGGTGVPAAGTKFHADALAQFTAAGIDVTSSVQGNVRPDCTGVSGCTSLHGIKETTVNSIIELKKACNCDITITAGTESTGGHTASYTGTGHMDGNKVDLRFNSKLDSYIKNSGWTKGTRSDGAVTYTDPRSKVIYALEDDHWDVKVP